MHTKCDESKEGDLERKKKKDIPATMKRTASIASLSRVEGNPPKPISEAFKFKGRSTEIAKIHTQHLPRNRGMEIKT